MQTFPGQVNTATSAQTSNTVSIHYDPLYLRTLSGRLKATQLVLNVLGFIFVTFSTISHSNRCGWFNTVAMTGFWTTGMLLLFYLFHIVEKFGRIPWLKIECIFCAFETIGYLLVSTLIAKLTDYSQSLGIAAFFGFVSMCVYGFDFWNKFKAMKSGDWPQGQRPVVKIVSTVTTPTGY